MQKSISLIVITDPGKDLDDEVALTYLAGLSDRGMISFCSVVACVKPSRERAMLARGTLDELGLREVSVGVGANVGRESKQTPSYQFEAVYKSDRDLLDGQSLLIQTLMKADDHSITILNISALTDLATLLRSHRDLVIKKVTRVVVMGGLKQVGESWILDDAYNNVVDTVSATFVYEQLASLGIPVTTVGRHAAYAASFPKRFYDDLATSNHPVAKRLASVQREAMKRYWEAACAKEGDELRGDLPARVNREWFIKTYFDGEDVPEGVDAWPQFKKFFQYDAIAAVAAIPEIATQYLLSESLSNTGTIIGKSSEFSGVPDATGLTDHITQVIHEALKK